MLLSVCDPAVRTLHPGVPHVPERRVQHWGTPHIALTWGFLLLILICTHVPREYEDLENKKRKMSITRVTFYIRVTIFLGTRVHRVKNPGITEIQAYPGAGYTLGTLGTFSGTSHRRLEP